jgi:hypothetical protein
MRSGVALGRLLVANELQRRGLHDDAGARDGDAFGLALVADIDHAGIAAFVEVAELLPAHAAFFIRRERTAASTSG